MSIVTSYGRYHDIYEIDMDVKPSCQTVNQALKECDIPFKHSLIEIKSETVSYDKPVKYKTKLLVMPFKRLNEIVGLPSKVDYISSNYNVRKYYSVENTIDQYKLTFPFEAVADRGLKSLIQDHIETCNFNDSFVFVIDFYKISFENRCLIYNAPFTSLGNPLLSFMVNSNKEILNDDIYTWFTGDKTINQLRKETISFVELLCKEYVNGNNNVIQFINDIKKKDVLKYFDLQTVSLVFSNYFIGVEYTDEPILIIYNKKYYLKTVHEKLQLLTDLILNYNYYRQIYESSMF